MKKFLSEVDWKMTTALLILIVVGGVLAMYAKEKYDKYEIARAEVNANKAIEGTEAEPTV